jgi:hypothetical protein
MRSISPCSRSRRKAVHVELVHDGVPELAQQRVRDTRRDLGLAGVAGGVPGADEAAQCLAAVVPATWICTTLSNPQTELWLVKQVTSGRRYVKP